VEQSSNEKYISWKSLLDIAFYCGIFFIVKDIAHSLSAISLSTFSGSLDYFTFLLGKFRFGKVIHILYIVVLLVGFLNLVCRSKLHENLQLRHYTNELSSPLCTSILHFIIFAVGIYFSVISSSIHRWLTEGTIVSYQNSFSNIIALFILSIIIFVLNQKALNKKKSETDNSLRTSYESKIDKLENIIRLAPPNDFSGILSNYVDVADDFVQAVNQNHKSAEKACLYAETTLKFKSVYKDISSFKTELNIDDVKLNENDILEMINVLKEHQQFNAKYIRALLIAYARLAALFDGESPSRTNNNVYRANLMLKYSNKDKSLPPAETIRYVPSVLKGHESLAITNYLTLHEEHSVEAYTEKVGITKKQTDGQFDPIKFDKDEGITTFSLPYFIGENKKSYNCFGAPRAVAVAEWQFINDTEDAIKDWESVFKPPIELVEEAKINFSARNIAKSIISIPLMHSRYDEDHKATKKVMGVVNIYRDKKDLMMGNKQKQKQFEHITTPLNFALAKIVTRDILHRYHANLLQEMLDFAIIKNPDIQEIANVTKTG